MKLGVVSSILEFCNFEEMLDIVAEAGLECVEVACWPDEKAERRYAGVSHIDVNDVSDDKTEYIKEACKKRSIEISSLAYYPNTLDADPDKREANIAHLHKVIDASAKLGVNLVTTFLGRVQDKTVEENLKIVEEVWPEIIKHAAERNVRIAIENCPMLFDENQWPGGQNLMTSPDNWRKIFEILPYDNFGINYDPSHFVWQMMDYIAPLYEFKDRIFHVHFKDIKLFKDKLKSCGTMAYPLRYMSPKLPGLGDVDWGSFVSAVTDIGYNSYCCIEVEDRAFESDNERIIDSIRLSKKYMDQFII